LRALKLAKRRLVSNLFLGGFKPPIYGVVMVSTGMNENHNTGRRYASNPKLKK
jgi:hypothetical protein